MIIYISGGVRSGKSRYAQQRALALSPTPVYVATAKLWDEDFAERVRIHKQDRGPEWTSYEAESKLYTLPLANRTVVIDCVTLWLTNLYVSTGNDSSKALADFKSEIDTLRRIPGTIIIISNEIGMGVHPESEVGRKFADLQGWANQYVASIADEAVFMVSGLPLFLKTSS